MKKPQVGLAFIAIGFAFIGLGATGRRTYLGVGVVFLILGLVQRWRQRDKGAPPSPPNV